MEEIKKPLSPIEVKAENGHIVFVIGNTTLTMNGSLPTTLLSNIKQSLDSAYNLGFHDCSEW